MLKHFVLFEKSPAGVKHLEELKATEAGKRDVKVVAGDSNIQLPAYLAANPIKEKEATFCLLG